jgi:hypothetical protein
MQTNAAPGWRGVLATMSLLVGACVGPANHSEHPSEHPASPDAAAAETGPLGAALREDPPLPGEERSGWPLLTAPAWSNADPDPGPRSSGGEHGHHH